MQIIIELNFKSFADLIIDFGMFLLIKQNSFRGIVENSLSHSIFLLFEFTTILLFFLFYSCNTCSVKILTLFDLIEFK